MTDKEFLNALANGQSDIVQMLLDILNVTGSRYCIIGGLAVNAYVEPVVSLDIDIVVSIENIETTVIAAQKRGLTIERFEHSVNITSPHSDLRILIQIDQRYQEFIPRAKKKNVLGYTMSVADLNDILQGKVWAYMDETRRKSKRQKDLADIFRIVEAYPQLETKLPPNLQEELEE